MRNTLRMLRLYLPLYLLLTAMPAFASDIHLGMDLSGSYNSSVNYLDRGDWEQKNQFHFSKDRTFGHLSAAPYCALALPQGIGGFFQANLDWENPSEETTDEEAVVDWTKAYLSLSRGGTNISLGLQTVYLGTGLVMADDVPAAAFELNRGKAYLGLTLSQALDSSPMVAATIGYHPGDFEHVELFGIWFRDQDNAFAKAIPLFYQLLLDPRSDGELYWAGVSAQLFVGRALFTAMGAYQWGQFRVYTGPIDSRHDVSAYCVDLSVERNLSDWCSLGAFFYMASGDDTPLRNDLNSFVAVMPLNSRADIFFDPKFLGRDENAEALTFSGGSVGGVLAPGLTLNLVPWSDLTLETTVASFYAQQALDDGSRWYGWEIDLALTYTFGKIYTFFAEAARFQHGDYYRSLLEETVDSATRVSIGLRASF
jgi:hypothetical protein